MFPSSESYTIVLAQIPEQRGVFGSLLLFLLLQMFAGKFEIYGSFAKTFPISANACRLLSESQKSHKIAEIDRILLQSSKTRGQISIAIF